MLLLRDCLEDLSHDGNEHVHECDLKHEGSEDKEGPEQTLGEEALISESIEVELTEGEKVHMEHCVDGCIAEVPGVDVWLAFTAFAVSMFQLIREVDHIG